MIDLHRSPAIRQLVVHPFLGRMVFKSVRSFCVLAKSAAVVVPPPTAKNGAGSLNFSHLSSRPVRQAQLSHPWSTTRAMNPPREEEQRNRGFVSLRLLDFVHPFLWITSKFAQVLRARKRFLQYIHRVLQQSRRRGKLSESPSVTKFCRLPHSSGHIRCSE